jgi:ankyrin repeat domain-containing protein 50
MSLALVNAGRPKPEDRLAQSIERFQTVLSSEQKAAFQAGRTLAMQESPQLRDVMHVTAEIERQARVSTSGRRRCFGPRITKVLQSIQEFVSVGDIVVGGSQNLLACGVWSLVRLSLLVRLATHPLTLL